MHYKLYYPQAFYTAAINRYGLEDNNNSTFDYIDFFTRISTIQDLNTFKAWISHSTDNPVKEKSQKTISNILWEMKLRGYVIKEPNFASAAEVCSPSKKDPHVILLPLKSLNGVGKVSANTVAKAYEIYGDKLFDMDIEELKTLKVTINGKEKTAFDKKFLDAYFKK